MEEKKRGKSMNLKRLIFTLLILLGNHTAASQESEASAMLVHEGGNKYLEIQAPLENGLVRTRIPAKEIEDSIKESLQDVVHVTVDRFADDLFHLEALVFRGSVRMELTLEVERQEKVMSNIKWLCDSNWWPEGVTLKDCFHLRPGRSDRPVYFSSYGTTTLSLDGLKMGEVLPDDDTPYFVVR